MSRAEAHKNENQLQAANQHIPSKWMRWSDIRSCQLKLCMDGTSKLLSAHDQKTVTVNFSTFLFQPLIAQTKYIDKKEYSSQACDNWTKSAFILKKV